MSSLLFLSKHASQATLTLSIASVATLAAFGCLSMLVAAIAFAVYLGPAPQLHVALHAGFVIGLAYVATSFGINYAFAGRSFKLWLIDGGYHTLQFSLYGLVLGLWH